MTKQVLILGATGQIAGHAITALLDETDATCCSSPAIRDI